MSSHRADQIGELAESFQAIKRKLGSKQLAAKEKHACTITPSQWTVLRTVMEWNRIGIKDIAQKLGISSSAATQLVDSLVQNGYLDRKQNPDDRRSLCIEISAKAKKQIHLLKKNRLQHLAEVFSVLSDKELEQYVQLNAKISAHIHTS